MEEKVVTFHRFTVRAQRRCEYPLSHIINMDETPMGFELPATRTLEFTGSPTVPITTCSAEKRSFTVALAVKANGEKLTPKVIFKGVLQLRIYGKYCRECKSQCTRRAGWMKKVFITSLVHFRFVLWCIKLLSTCTQVRIISSIVGEFVYIWSPFDHFSAYVWVYH